MRAAKTPEGPFSIEFQLPDPTRERWALNGGGEHWDWNVALDEARSPAERLPDLSVVRIMAARRPAWVGVVASGEAVALGMTPARAQRLAKQWQGRGATPASMLDAPVYLGRRALVRIAVAVARTCEGVLPEDGAVSRGAREALRRAEAFAAGGGLTPADSVGAVRASIRGLEGVAPTSARKAAEACWSTLLVVMAGPATAADVEGVSLVALEAAAAYAWSLEPEQRAHDRRNRLAAKRGAYLAQAARSAVSLGEFLRVQDVAEGVAEGAPRDRSVPVGSLVQGP